MDWNAFAFDSLVCFWYIYVLFWSLAKNFHKA